MRLPHFIAAAIGILVAPIVGAETGRTNIALNGHSFSVPEGFSLQLAADSATVPHPVSASLDGIGNLFVTDSSGTPDVPSEQLKHPSHRVLRLADTHHDGHYDQAVVFADHVMFPEGCLACQGSVYVAAPPSIWRYTDKDGDGVADEAVEWWKGGTLTGCANDLHGPYLGPDGYIYWTKGAFAEQTHERPGRSPIHDRAAHIYRAKPDGSELELVMSGGMDNPVEVAFNLDGEAFFTSTFIDFTQPGRRDGLAHAVYGGVYGKVNSVLEDGLVKRSSHELLPVMTQFGPGAACGLCTYYSVSFGPEYRGNLFATTFNLHKVSRHQIQPQGASFRTIDEDFLTSPDVDFHPTDVLEDGDGSLLVIDTGGWYKLCCPSSQLVKPDVRGAIYRISRDGSPAIHLPTGRIPPHRDGPLWTMKQAGLHREVSALPALRQTVESFIAAPKSEAIATARVAIESIGRIGDASSVPLLLKASAFTDDPFFFHSVSYALIEIHAAAPTLDGLMADSAITRRAALMALDQMDAAPLKAAQVTPLLTADDRSLRDAAHWVLAHHKEWAASLVEWFQSRLLQSELSGQSRSALEGELPLFNELPAAQQFLGELARGPRYPESTRRAAFIAMAAASDANPPEAWADALIEVLNRPQHPLMSVAISAAGRISKKTGITAALHQTAQAEANSAEIRLTALHALPAGSALMDSEVDFLLLSINPSHPPQTRSVASETLGHSRLSPGSLGKLVGVISTAGPVELSRLLAAFDTGGDESIGRRILGALREIKAVRSIPLAELRVHLAKFPESVRNEAEPFFTSIHQDAAEQAKQLEALWTTLQQVPGDLNRGQSLFNGPKAACSTCHKIGYLGGEVGPELTKIGEVRSERDLLESIVYPSASFVRSYEPLQVTLKDGDNVNGILRNETAQELELVTGPGPTRHLLRSDIVQTQPGTVSIMPAGLGDALSHQELADILKFVKTVRWR